MRLPIQGMVGLPRRSIINGKADKLDSVVQQTPKNLASIADAFGEAFTWQRLARAFAASLRLMNVCSVSRMCRRGLRAGAGVLWCE